MNFAGDSKSVRLLRLSRPQGTLFTIDIDYNKVTLCTLTVYVTPSVKARLALYASEAEPWSEYTQFSFRKIVAIAMFAF